MMAPSSKVVWNISLLLWLVVVSPAFASTPNTILRVEGIDEEWLAKRGEFGSAADKVTGQLVHSPPDDEMLCNYFDERNATETMAASPITIEGPIILMAPRGICSFARKALAAKEVYGAIGLIVYDTIAGRYRWNETIERVILPIRQQDYECENGFGTMHNLNLDPPPYNATALDPLMDLSLPATVNCSLVSREPCESQICLVTSHAENSTDFPVCCAWDTLITMQGDPTIEGDSGADDVVPVMITIRQSEEWLDFVGRQVTIEARPTTPWNISQLFLWMLGVFVATLATWLSAGDYRVFRAKLASVQGERKPKREESGDTVAAEEGTLSPENDLLNVDDDDGDERPNEEAITNRFARYMQKMTNSSSPTTLHSLPPRGKEREGKDEPIILWERKKKSTSQESSMVLHSLPPPEKKRRRPLDKKKQNEDDGIQVPGLVGADDSQPLPERGQQQASFELTMFHVAGFIVFSSLFLILLFYLKFYWLVSIFYGLGSAAAVSRIMFEPFLHKVVPRLGEDWEEDFNKSVLFCLNGYDVLGKGAGYIWATIWLWYGFSHYRPSRNWFFWITMDVFGTCFCISVLLMLKLNSIKIATIFMLAIFVYDVFFVFVTPLFLDGESLMITVARGGAEGTSTADDFCYKYPSDKACTGIDFLPMLLAIPRIGDWQEGTSLLGLGDIVLPGFLIAYAARTDEASRLVGNHTSRDIKVPNKWYQGFFFPLVVAYAVGLLLAFTAVSLMERGQPALLYVVPCLLGTFVVLARNELRQHWEESRSIRMADRMIQKCEKFWGRQKMQRAIDKRKRERELEAEQNGEGATPNKSRDFDRQPYSNGGPRRSAPALLQTTAKSQRLNGDSSTPPRPMPRNNSRKASLVQMDGPVRQTPLGSPGDTQQRNGRKASIGQPGRRPDDRQLANTSNGPQQVRPPPGRSPRGPPGSHPPNGQNPPRRSQSTGTGPSTGPPTVTRNGPPSRASTGKKQGPPPPQSSRVQPPPPGNTSKGKNTPPSEHVSSQSQERDDEKKGDDKVLDKAPDPDGEDSPDDEDVCFGKEDHTGTKHFRRAVRKAVKTFATQDYGPEVYKHIKKQLKGKRIFKESSPGLWKEADKSEIIDGVRKAFDEERTKVQTK